MNYHMYLLVTLERGAKYELDLIKLTGLALARKHAYDAAAAAA